MNILLKNNKNYRVVFLKCYLLKFKVLISQLLVDVQDTDFKRFFIQIVLQVVRVTALWSNIFIHKISI